MILIIDITNVEDVFGRVVMLSAALTGHTKGKDINRDH